MTDWDSLETIAKLVWDAVTNGNWWALAAAAMVLTVFVARRMLVKRFPVIGTDRGGILLSLLGGTGFGVAVALLGGQALGVAVILASVKVAIASMGGFTIVRKFFWGSKESVTPSLRPTEYMAPVTPGGAKQAIDNETPRR